MLLLDFNYFFNKAVNQYINKRYNIYDVNQQTTDDLRVLKSTSFMDENYIYTLDTVSGVNMNSYKAGKSTIYGGTYYVDLPLDYLHMLNCICVYEVQERYKCYNAGDNVLFAAKRLTGDSWSVIINDFYNRPLPERPYFYINNVNSSHILPTNPIEYNDKIEYGKHGTDIKADYIDTATITLVAKFKKTASDEEEEVPAEAITEAELKKKYPNAVVTATKEYVTTTGVSNFPRTVQLGSTGATSTVERVGGMRYGNASNVRCEIRYGSDASVFKLVGVMIDYIKAPQQIRLTQELVNLTRDTSLVMEFPDYVCLEIINELVNLVMENTADPRLQTHNTVTQSIANPVQQLQQPAMTRALQRAVSQG